MYGEPEGIGYPDWKMFWITLLPYIMLLMKDITEMTRFSFCNQVMIGFAAMRGRGLDEDPQLLVFWDGKPGSVGGTGNW